MVAKETCSTCGATNVLCVELEEVTSVCRKCINRSFDKAEEEEEERVAREQHDEELWNGEDEQKKQREHEAMYNAWVAAKKEEDGRAAHAVWTAKFVEHFRTLSSGEGRKL